MHTYTHTHTQMHTYTHTHTQMHTYTHTHTQMHTYTHTHTQMHTYTHTHTQMHTYRSLQQRLALLQSQLTKTEAELERVRAARNEAQGRVETANTAKLRALERYEMIFFFGAHPEGELTKELAARTKLSNLSPNLNAQLQGAGARCTAY